MLLDSESNIQGVTVSEQKNVPNLAVSNVDALELAARAVSELCKRIEEGEDVSAATEAAFDDQELQLSDAVDRNIEAIRNFEKAIEERKAYLAEAATRLKTFEMAYDGLRALLAERIEQNRDIEYRGRLGMIVLQVRGAPSLEYAWKTFGPTAIKTHKVPERFYKAVPKTDYKIDAKAIKEALDAGEEISWCSLKQTKFIVIRKG